MNIKFVRDILWGLFFLLIQIMLVRHLALFDAQADLVFLFILFLAISRERTHTILITAIIAFFFDAFLDTWGLNLFVKVISIFLVYNFVPKLSENKLLSIQVFTVIVIASFIHNLFFVGMSSVISLYENNVLFWEIIIGNSLYTSILGTFIYNFSSATQGN